MDKPTLTPTFLKQQHSHSYAPADLTAMQGAFNQMCRDGGVLPDDEIERDAIAHAVVTVYDSKMDEAALLAAARAIHGDGPSKKTSGLAKAEYWAAPFRISAAR